jgi:hypothetical protein
MNYNEAVKLIEEHLDYGGSLDKHALAIAIATPAPSDAAVSDERAVCGCDATCQDSEVGNCRHVSLNDERAAFEKWREDADPAYSSAWHAWQRRAALVQTAPVGEAKPLAWFYYEDGEFIRMYDSAEKAEAGREKFGGEIVPVYATPPASREALMLSDEQVLKLAQRFSLGSHEYYKFGDVRMIAFAKELLATAVERAGEAK